MAALEQGGGQEAPLRCEEAWADVVAGLLEVLRSTPWRRSKPLAAALEGPQSKGLYLRASFARSLSQQAFKVQAGQPALESPEWAREGRQAAWF